MMDPPQWSLRNSGKGHVPSLSVRLIVQLGSKPATAFARLAMPVEKQGSLACVSCAAPRHAKSTEIVEITFLASTQPLFGTMRNKKHFNIFCIYPRSYKLEERAGPLTLDACHPQSASPRCHLQPSAAFLRFYRARALAKSLHCFRNRKVEIMTSRMQPLFVQLFLLELASSTAYTSPSQ